MVAIQGLLATALIGFASQIETFPTGIVAKIRFDIDYIGRAREAAFIEETARSTYQKAGVKVNVAVWNMHIREQHDFTDILETGLKPMGAGGGFRVVVFTGEGFLRNENEVAEHNWRVSGNHVVRGNVAEFGPAGGCGYFWGCMGNTYGNWMQRLW